MHIFLRIQADYLVPKKAMINNSRFMELQEQQKGSGLSVRGFCSNEGIAPSTFYYWQKKVRKAVAGERFIPLHVRTPGSSAHPATNEPPVPGMENTPLEITYPNGTTLRIQQTIDIAGLRSLVSLLD